jgi:hypothetical protein
MEGAFSTTLIHRDPDYARAAGRTAAIIVTMATEQPME